MRGSMPPDALFPRILLQESLSAPDEATLAKPLTAEDAAAMGAAHDFSLPAPLFVAGEATSTFDLGWRLVQTLVESLDLPPWSAVIARSQTGGRGQLRREWHSPAGNLYVSFFLPEGLAKLESMASLCVGYLVRAALADMGIAAELKWPNDLLLTAQTADGRAQGKFGGILLEEREGRVLAGLGLNLCHAPGASSLREGHAVPAVALTSFDGTVCAFWAALLKGLIRHYERDIAHASLEAVRQRVETALAWRGLTVYTDAAKATGRMAGITEDGFLRLETENGCLLIDSGSIRRV